MIKTGTLYGLGVGPGDPELLTLKAVRILGSVDVVFAACSTKNDYSRSLDIVRPHCQEGVRTEQLGFPMTHDKAVLDAAWESNARAVLAELDAGRDCAFLTLGDPLLYSTFIYLLRTLERIAVRGNGDGSPAIPVEIVPGITSFQNAAALSRKPLVEAGETLLVFPGVRGEEELRAKLAGADKAVILKTYKNYQQIRTVLDQEGLAEDAVFASRMGMEDEIVVRGAGNAPEKPHYLSLLLVGHDGVDGGVTKKS